MYSKKSRKDSDAVAEKEVDKGALVVQCVTLVVALLAPTLAFAADGGAGSIFCYIAQNLKAIIGTCMLVAVSLWAIEHVFKVSKIHDIVITVGVVAIVVSGFSLYIANSQFTTSCAF